MTRMWLVPPSMMCRAHLLGEHNEIHKVVGSMLKGKSLQGWITRGHLDLLQLRSRHDALVVEMQRRGYKHLSPLPEYSLESYPSTGKVDSVANVRELAQRCVSCARIQMTRRPSCFADVEPKS